MLFHLFKDCGASDEVWILIVWDENYWLSILYPELGCRNLRHTLGVLTLNSTSCCKRTSSQATENLHSFVILIVVRPKLDHV